VKHTATTNVTLPKGKFLSDEDGEESVRTHYSAVEEDVDYISKYRHDRRTRVAPRSPVLAPPIRRASSCVARSCN
jgi:hypothetical protein